MSDICVILGTSALICFCCALARARAGQGATVTPVCDDGRARAGIPTATVTPVCDDGRYDHLGFAPALDPRDGVAVLIRNGGDLTPGPVPAWVISQRRGRGICEMCGEEPAVTEWAGTGQLIGWACCERKRQEGQG